MAFTLFNYPITLKQNKVEIYEKLVFNRSSLVVIASITADLLQSHFSHGYLVLGEGKNILPINHLHRIRDFRALKFLRNLRTGRTDARRLFLRCGWLCF